MQSACTVSHTDQPPTARVTWKTAQLLLVGLLKNQKAGEGGREGQVSGCTLLCSLAKACRIILLPMRALPVVCSRQRGIKISDSEGLHDFLISLLQVGGGRSCEGQVW